MCNPIDEDDMTGMALAKINNYYKREIQIHMTSLCCLWTFKKRNDTQNTSNSEYYFHLWLYMSNIIALKYTGKYVVASIFNYIKALLVF